MASDRPKALGISSPQELRIEWNAVINLVAIGAKVNRKRYSFKLALIAELSTLVGVRNIGPNLRKTS